MKRYILFLLHPLFIMSLGILMSVLSAVVTHYLVAKNVHSVTTLQEQSQSLEQRIAHQWDRLRTLEEKENTGSLLMLVSGNTLFSHLPVIERHITQTLVAADIDKGQQTELSLSLRSREKSPLEILEKIFSIVDVYRTQSINHIDAMYIERLSLESKIDALEEKNRRLQTIALLFHIFGLILVVIPSAHMRMNLS